MNGDQATQGIAENQTTPSPRITVCAQEGQSLNGLGMMIQQYLEQNLADFDHKVEAGLRIRGRVCVEVEKGIATTVSFRGEEIRIEKSSPGLRPGGITCCSENLNPLWSLLIVKPV